MYDHTKTAILPQAQYDWQNIRLQDFKSVSIRVAPYPSRILSALAQLQAGLTGLKRVILGRGSPTYKALGSAMRERCGIHSITTRELCPKLYNLRK